MAHMASIVADDFAFLDLGDRRLDARARLSSGVLATNPDAGFPKDNGGQGFYAHFSLLAASPKQPLGLVAVETWTRAAKPCDAPKHSQRERYLAPDKESLRWMRAAHEVERVLEGQAEIVHVMDREADDFDILCGLATSKYLFVVRASTDRRLAADHEGTKLKAFARELEVRVERDVQLSGRRKKRPAKDRKKFPPRDARPARLTVSSGTIALRRPEKASKDLPDTLELNVLYVTEPHPPNGCQPVEWILLTNQLIDAEEQLLQIVDGVTRPGAEPALRDRRIDHDPARHPIGEGRWQTLVTTNRA